ncbi:MAG: AtpZ/AtpI family protein [Phycisphaerales bacterium]|nr:AtpZ/AtpI family protein [Phycisphaerales bacterium]
MRDDHKSDSSDSSKPSDAGRKGGDSGNKLGPSLWGLAGMGFDLAAAVAGFTLIGWWADSHWNTSPRYTVVGVVLGLIGGMYNLLRRALKASKDANQAFREHDTHDNRDT